MSAINTGSINVNYPVPGVNNSSQGFRDNFNGIKTNLDTASTEITDLQNKAIVKSALTGVVLNNDMANTLISNALTQGFRSTTFNLGNNLSGAVSIDLSKGDVQYGTITGNTALSFTKWAPTGTYSTVHLMLTVPSAGSVISLPAQVNTGVSTLENYTATMTGGNVTVLGSLGLDSPSVLHYVFSTKDCGNNIEVMAVNRPRKATQLTTTVPASLIGVQGDRAGTVATNSVNAYVCTADYDGVSTIWKKIPLFGTVPSSSVGASGDLAGAMAINSSYIYYCTANYNGVSNIWSRVQLVGGSW